MLIPHTCSMTKDFGWKKPFFTEKIYGIRKKINQFYSNKYIYGTKTNTKKVIQFANISLQQIEAEREKKNKCKSIFKAEKAKALLCCTKGYKRIGFTIKAVINDDRQQLVISYL